MRTVHTLAEALGAQCICRLSQPDGTWLIYESGDTLPDRVFGPPDTGVPPGVTMRQARLALLSAGKLGLVDAAIAAMPETHRSAASISWEYSQMIARHDPLVTQLAAGLGMSGAEVDALFVAAAAL